MVTKLMILIKNMSKITKELTEVIALGLGDEKALKILKRILRENGYKTTQSAAQIMLDSISDLLPPKLYNFWSAVSVNL